ncbi:MAG: hypothetical protein U9N58_05560 [Thermodesulfobacteriota bacterium]|nr:hypothetical protein [Thermodesulfobacteriota bacterium]
MPLRRGFILLLLALLWSPTAMAEKIAVFPIEDLNQGPNGVDFALTEYLENDLKARGLEVSSKEAVISFMARNRIRRLGFLNTYHISQVRKELGADLILLGTVSQRSEKPAVAFGMVLYLIRTDDARTVWSQARGLSCNDVRHVLGIAEPRSAEDLWSIAVQDILENWPEDMGFDMDRNAVSEIAEIDLGKRYVSPGKKVTCKLRLRSVEEGDRPEVTLRVRGRGHLRMKHKGGDLYQASWTASATEGSYPVSLILNWPSGKHKVAFLGIHHVDNNPPALALGIRGLRLKGAVAFRDRILIIPRLLEREPISRWNFSVQDEQGRTILQEDREENLPKRFIWQGYTDEGVRVADGNYQVVVKVWDQARNMAVVSERLAVMRKPPDMVLEAETRGQGLVLDIRNEGKVPIAFWHMEIWDDDDNLIKTADGETLPAEVDVVLPESAVECVLTAKDILGNQFRREIKDLKLLVRQEDVEGIVTEEWSMEF